MALWHSVLVLVYVLLPIVAVVLAIVRARRARAWRAVRATAGTWVSGAMIGGGLVAVYAGLTNGRSTVGQVLLAGYFATAVLYALKGFDWALRHAVMRLFRLRGPTAPTGPSDGAGAATQTTGPEQAPAPSTSAPLPRPRRVRGREWRIAGAGVVRVIVLFGLGLPFVMAVGMVYRPKVVGEDPGEQFEYAFEDISFEATDGMRIAGWWIPAGKAPVRRGARSAPDPLWGRRTILLCHGLGANKSNQLKMGATFVPEGYNVLAFDFRAHGASGGQLTSFGDLERRDVLGAVRWLRANHPDATKKVFGLGSSMGAAALIAAAADDSPEGRWIDAIAVYGTFDDLGAMAQSVAQRYFPQPLGWATLNVGIPIAGAHVGRDLMDFAPARDVKRMSPRPILVIHGRQDEIVRFDHGTALFEAAEEPKSQIWIDSGDHNNVIDDPDATRAVRRFFEEARSIL